MTRPHRGEGGVGLRSAAFGLVWSVVLTSNSAMFALILVEQLRSAPGHLRTAIRCRARPAAPVIRVFSTIHPVGTA